MTEIYSAQTFGYAQYTEAVIESKKLQDKEKIIHEFLGINEPKEFCKKLLQSNSFDQSDIMDFANFDREKSSNLISLLVRKNGIYKAGGRYYKNPEFVESVKHWASNGVFDKNMPEYLKRKKEAEKAEKF